MKASIKSLLFAALAGFSTLGAHAQQPAPKIFVVDLAKLFQEYYETKDQSAVMNQKQQSANDYAKTIIAQRDELVGKFQALADKVNGNPAISNEARADAEKQATQLRNDIVSKNNELQTFLSNNNDTLQKEFKNFRDVTVGKICDVATRIAKQKGATLLIDISKGATVYGTNGFIYTDPGYADLTDEVLKTMNAGHAATAAAAAPAASPTITFPTPAKP